MLIVFRWATRLSIASTDAVHLYAVLTAGTSPISIALPYLVRMQSDGFSWRLTLGRGQHLRGRGLYFNLCGQIGIYLKIPIASPRVTLILVILNGISSPITDLQVNRLTDPFTSFIRRIEGVVASCDGFGRT